MLETLKWLQGVHRTEMPPTVFRFSQVSGDQVLRPKLFGVGSAGCNMIGNSQFPTVAFSTSSTDIAKSHAQRQILIGQDRLVGLTETRHGILKHLPSIAGHEVLDIFNNTDIAFLLCGLGGVAGSLGSRLLAAVSQSKGSACVVLAATPFSAESLRRREMASRTLDALLETCTLCVEFDNDKLSSLAPNLPMSRAFALMNSIMMRPVLDLLSSMSRLDIGVLRRVLDRASYGRFGLGLGRGDERVAHAVSEAFVSPWFDYPLSKTDAAIVIYSSADPWDKEANEIVAQVADGLPNARIAFGSYRDPSLNDRIRVSVIAARRKGG